jgi:hypothetical protein
MESWIREPRRVYDALLLHEWCAGDKRLGLLILVRRESDNIAALKSDGELFTLGRSRNFQVLSENPSEKVDYTNCYLEKSRASLRRSTRRLTAGLIR